jgi:hypothetical protein
MSNNDQNDDIKSFKSSNSSETSETITVIEDKKDHLKCENENNDKNYDLNNERSPYELIIEENVFELTTFETSLNISNSSILDVNNLNNIKSLEKQLISEQEKYAKLQEKYRLSEKHRLELTSQNNKEIFAINTQYAKLRSEFEKNEAYRQTLEYELTLAKSNSNKEKQLASDKEKTFEEITKNLKGIIY